MSAHPQIPATTTDLLTVLNEMPVRAHAPYGYDGDDANAWESGWERGVEDAAAVTKAFVAAHPDQFQSLTGEQVQAVQDVTAVALGYTQRRGQWINARAAANVLLPITDPENGAPASMAPYLTFGVSLAPEGSPIIATFDALADARAFAEMKSGQGEPHVVRF